MDMTSVFAPITKSTEQDDGSLLVYGKVTDDGLDLDGQRCDKTWLSEAIPAWFGTGTGVGGNIRAQHRSDSAIGKAIEHEDAEDGHYVTARIVDRDAIVKTKAGVYTGFSVGIKNPRIVKSPSAPNGLLAGGSVIEVSLVDRPANPACLITLCKAATPGMEINAADFDEELGLVRCEDVIDKTAEPEETGMTVTLADALPADQVEKLAAAAEPAELPEPADTPAVAEPAAEKSADGLMPVSEAREKLGLPETPAVDVDTAKALVDATIAKVDGDDLTDMTTFAPPSDEDLASVAISIIGRLIQSEAGDMVANPGEDDDIRCLLSAVASLRWFIRRERQEGGPGGESDAAPYEYMAATPDDTAADPVAEKAAERNALGDLAPAGAVTVIAPKAADPAEKTVEPTPAATTEPAATKTIDADTGKATVVEDTDSADPDALVKALTAALSKSDNPLRKSFQDIVTASTETTAQAVEALSARLVKVENMAVPGGPALRRTEVERTSARRNDLVGQIMRVKSLADSTHDPVLRKGYTAQAEQLETEIKALTA